jgi:hypothetical protein
MHLLDNAPWQAVGAMAGTDGHTAFNKTRGPIAKLKQLACRNQPLLHEIAASLGPVVEQRL